MNNLRIYPDPVLRSKVQKVECIESERINYLTGIMEKTIEEHSGVGIAAPQVGILEQIILINLEERIVLINPEIIKCNGNSVMKEGCLSLPGIEVEVLRSSFVVVRGFDEYGRKKVVEADELLARILQHEIDHLMGVLIIDKLPPDERVKFHMNWERRKDERRNSPPIL